MFLIIHPSYLIRLAYSLSYHLFPFSYCWLERSRRVRKCHCFVGVPSASVLLQEWRIKLVPVSYVTSLEFNNLKKQLEGIAGEVLSLSFLSMTLSLEPTLCNLKSPLLNPTLFPLLQSTSRSYKPFIFRIPTLSTFTSLRNKSQKDG